MADDGSNTGVFAQHYRTGKYADLTLIAKDGTQFNVHRLVVCTLSPVLDAQAADGVKTIEMNEDAATVGQLVKWMYGIDKKLLKNGNSVDEITAIGPNALYHEILVLAYFAKTAEKYQMLKIKDQATELIDQLTKNLSSMDIILEAVLQLAPDGLLGDVQKALILHALSKNLDRHADVTSHPRQTNEDRTSTPVASHVNAREAEQNDITVNINRSALRSAKTPVRSSQADDDDSDAPLSQQSKKRKMLQTPHFIQEPNTKMQPPSFAREMNLKYSPVRKPRESLPAGSQVLSHNASPPSQAQNQHRQKPRSLSEQQQARKKSLDQSHKTEKSHPDPNLQFKNARQAEFAEQIRKKLETERAATKLPQTRRNEPFRISTALPENDPPQGPHCYCKVAESDITLLACADCGRKFHPRCVGKGRFAKGTYSGGDTKGYMLKDLDAFVDKKFKCGDCEAGYFGGR